MTHPLGEFDIISRYFARACVRSDVLLGVGDDAAVLQPHENHRLVVAMDTIVENVHFPAGTDPHDIGYRALAVNLSDLAAMGAEPAWMTLSLSLPTANEDWLRGFATGLFALADEFSVALVGGDTVRGPLVVTIQVAGYVETDRWLTRSGAQPGDPVFVSGVPGEAAAGLTLIQSRQCDDKHMHLRQRFLRPQPRVPLGRKLRAFATSAMDVSDGLLTDLSKLCAASNCGAVLDVDALPKSATMQELFSDENCVKYALAGGDDYELIFTVDAANAHLVTELAPACTQIGVITAGSGVRCKRNGRDFEWTSRGYDHFAQSAGAP